MSRTSKGSKGPGFDYWSNRPSANDSPHKGVKEWCRRTERHRAKQAIREGRHEQLLKREAF